MCLQTKQTSIELELKFFKVAGNHPQERLAGVPSLSRVACSMRAACLETARRCFFDVAVNERKGVPACGVLICADEQNKVRTNETLGFPKTGVVQLHSHFDGVTSLPLWLPISRIFAHRLHDAVTMNPV